MTDEDIKNLYDKYFDDLHTAGNEIKLKSIVKTPRKGIKRKLRDNISFYKAAWQNAESWAGLPKAFVYWLALTPLAISTFNEFIGFLGISIAIPLDWGSIISVSIVAGLMVFGILAFTKMGLIKRSSEIGSLHNSFNFLIYKQNEEIKELLKEQNKLLKSTTE